MDPATLAAMAANLEVCARIHTHCARAFLVRVALGIASGSRINLNHGDSA
jgi:hypothetical protein